MTNNTTFSVDLNALTVMATDASGESHDLNAGGEPCATAADLGGFVAELCEQGAFDALTRDGLLAAL
jgi:hypothetical protein